MERASALRVRPSRRIIAVGRARAGRSLGQRDLAHPRAYPIAVVTIRYRVYSNRHELCPEFPRDSLTLIKHCASEVGFSWPGVAVSTAAIAYQRARIGKHSFLDLFCRRDRSTTRCVGIGKANVKTPTLNIF